MTLTPSRPVPEAASEEQQRLEVELLMGEPVLEDIQLQAVGQDLLLSGKGLCTDRWRELGALPLHESDGRLVVAVPSHWTPQQRQELREELQRAGFGADLQLALASNLTAVLHARPPNPSPPRPPAPPDPSPRIWTSPVHRTAISRRPPLSKTSKSTTPRQRARTPPPSSAWWTGF